MIQTGGASSDHKRDFECPRTGTKSPKQKVDTIAKQKIHIQALALENRKDLKRSKDEENKNNKETLRFYLTTEYNIMCD